jgi:2-polyprenyl-3-methyl-5-hydroxy-6-metoxy-1,4-benzoquinol methylase
LRSVTHGKEAASHLTIDDTNSDSSRAEHVDGQDQHHYEPKTYWEERLSRHGGLRGTGHISFSESYNQWLYKAKERALSSVLGDFDLRGRKVLDVGCGTGYFARLYARRGARVSGVDIARSNIDRLRASQEGDFRMLDISEPDTVPFDTFDVATAWDVLYHVVDDGAFRNALRFIATSIAPGGLFLASDRLAASTDACPAAHVKMRCLASYEAPMHELGFKLERVGFLYGLLNRYVTLPQLDSLAAPIYFWLDGLRSTPAADNLCLGVWRRTTSS